MTNTVLGAGSFLSKVGNYAYNLIRGLDQVALNATLAGNSRQTLSSRLYEAAVLAGLSRWKPLYWLVNGGAYVVRWAIMRPLGYQWGKDMPTNHCRWSFWAFPNDRTYG